MSDVSKAAYGPDWMEHLEYALWYAIVNGPMRYGRIELTSEMLTHLRFLSDACAGWICFDAEAGKRWVALADWQDIFTRNVEHVLVEGS